MFHSYLETSEFADPDPREELRCKGRRCAMCHKCRDWHFTGGQATWNKIIHWNNWSEAEWNRFFKDNAGWKHFEKRKDGGTCSYGYHDSDYYAHVYGTVDNTTNEDLRDFAIKYSLGIAYVDHLCVCEKH